MNQPLGWEILFESEFELEILFESGLWWEILLLTPGINSWKYIAKVVFSAFIPQNVSSLPLKCRVKHGGDIWGCSVQSSWTKAADDSSFFVANSPLSAPSGFNNLRPTPDQRQGHQLTEEYHRNIPRFVTKNTPRISQKYPKNITDISIEIKGHQLTEEYHRNIPSFITKISQEYFRFIREIS